MAVWVSGVLLLVSVSVVAGSCPAGRYGYRCSYQCQCPQPNCNPTSGCQPATCSRGWSGPTCQKENVALGKTTSSSSVYFPPSNAINGDTRGNDVNRCFFSAFNDASITFAWWRVDLGEVTLVHDVIIYFRTAHKVRRNGIQIYIADTVASPTDGVNCYTVTGNRYGTDIPDVLKVTCSGEGRYVVLYTIVRNSGDSIPILDFCEVEVNGREKSVNVPVKDFCEVEVEVCGPGTFGADCDNYCHCDGDVCDYVTGVCPSGVCLPGWQTDKCDTECGVGNYGTNCIKVCSERHCKGDNSSCDNVTGQCVGGCEAGRNGTDCTEKCVISYGEGCAYLCFSRKCNGSSSCNHVTGKCERGCVPGFKHVDCAEACIQGVEYGANCSGYCNARMCKDGNVTCPQDSGRCENGCQPGFKGQDCTTACIQGMEYGVGCAKSCSTRMCQGDASTCPRDTGRCTDGCQAGWRGVDCRQECVDGVKYGVGCVKYCSTRMCQGDWSTCPRDTGRCTDGCQAGWRGEDCTTACVQGMEYGAWCLKTCSTRMCQGDTSTCPRDTGQCTDGCQAGWKGEDCTTVCSLGTYGANCSGTCGQCRDSKTCHQVTGACPDGCSDGWTNHTCTQVVKSLLGNGAGQISHLAAGFMGAVAMLVLLAAVIGALWLWRKGDFRIAKTSKESGTPVTNPAPPVEVPTYDVLPEHDYTKLDRIHTEHYETLQPTVHYQNIDVST